MRATPNKRFNEQNNGCARAFWILVDFFSVLCKSTTWNDQVLCILEKEKLRHLKVKCKFVFHNVSSSLSPSSLLKLHNMVVNLKTHVGQTEQISRHYLALRRMLWRHFSAEEPWVLEWIRIPSDTCGRVNLIWIRYVWTGKFLNPERKRCGFKNIRIRVDRALVFLLSINDPISFQVRLILSLFNSNCFDR